MRVCNTRLSSAARRVLRTVRLAVRLRDARVVVRALAFSDRRRCIGIGRCMLVIATIAIHTARRGKPVDFGARRLPRRPHTTLLRKFRGARGIERESSFLVDF